MKQEYHKQLYLQGLASRDSWTVASRDEEDKYYVRIGKSGKGNNQYFDRVKEMNSSKGGTLMPHKVYCRRVWEGVYDVSGIERMLLKHFKLIKNNSDFRHQCGDWFYDKNGIIEKFVTNYFEVSNKTNSKHKAVEIPVAEVAEKAGSSKVKVKNNKGSAKRTPNIDTPITIKFDGEVTEHRFVSSSMAHVIEELYKKEGDTFVTEALLKSQPDEEWHDRVRPWFTTDPKDIGEERWSTKVPGVDLYYVTNNNSLVKINRCIAIAKHFGYDFSVVTK